MESAMVRRRGEVSGELCEKWEIGEGGRVTQKQNTTKHNTMHVYRCTHAPYSLGKTEMLVAIHLRLHICCHLAVE